MTNGINDLSGGQTARELDARSGAFVNDTTPGTDGSVRGVNLVPASNEATAQLYALTNRVRDALTNGLRGRERTILAAAIGVGLLALGTFLSSRRRTRRPSLFAGFLRSRPRRGLFG